MTIMAGDLPGCLVVELEKDGYFVQEIIGTHRILALWGSEPDPSAVLDAYRQ
jgi:hypothetical protein